MKKTLISVALLSFLGLSAARAADGTINFNGEIITAACTVETADQNQTVELGTVSSTAFGSVGSSASTAPIKIRLSACDPAITKMGVRFDGMTDATNPNLLSVTGGATGVGIGIYETDNTLIPINNKSAAKSLASGSSQIELNYVAKIVSTVAAGAITAGKVTSSAQFTVDYN